MVPQTAGYGPKVADSPQGFPVYLYTDPQSKRTSYVVVHQDGRAFYSDQKGNISASPIAPNNTSAFLALIGGVVGLLVGGPGGAIVGAAAGAALGSVPSAIEKKKVA